MHFPSLYQQYWIQNDKSSLHSQSGTKTNSGKPIVKTSRVIVRTQQVTYYQNSIDSDGKLKQWDNIYINTHSEARARNMGSACTTESRSPSPVQGRNGVILGRPASVTSYELKMEKMRAEVEQVRHRWQFLSASLSNLFGYIINIYLIFNRPERNSKLPKTWEKILKRIETKWRKKYRWNLNMRRNWGKLRQQSRKRRWKKVLN